MYSSTLSLTSVLNGGVLRQASAASPKEKTRYPLCRRLSGTQGLLWKGASISTPSGFDPPTVQPVASRCTDWAIPANLRKVYDYIITGGLSQCCRNDSYYLLPPISPNNLIASAFLICVLWLSEWLLVHYNTPIGHISKRVDRFDIF